MYKCKWDERKKNAPDTWQSTRTTLLNSTEKGSKAQRMTSHDLKFESQYINRRAANFNTGHRPRGGDPHGGPVRVLNSCYCVRRLRYSHIPISPIHSAVASNRPTNHSSSRVRINSPLTDTIHLSQPRWEAWTSISHVRGRSLDHAKACSRGTAGQYVDWLQVRRREFNSLQQRGFYLLLVSCPNEP